MADFPLGQLLDSMDASLGLALLMSLGVCPTNAYYFCLVMLSAGSNLYPDGKPSRGLNVLPVLSDQV
jgi:hypothetical protein